AKQVEKGLLHAAFLEAQHAADPAPWIDLLHAAFGDALPAGASTDAIVKAFAAAARDEMASALAAWDADPTELQVAAAEAGHYYEAVRPHLSADDEAV